MLEKADSLPQIRARDEGGYERMIRHWQIDCVTVYLDALNSNLYAWAGVSCFNVSLP